MTRQASNAKGHVGRLLKRRQSKFHTKLEACVAPSRNCFRIGNFYSWIQLARSFAPGTPVIVYGDRRVTLVEMVLLNLTMEIINLNA